MTNVLSQLNDDIRYAVRFHWANRVIAATSLTALVIAFTTTGALFTIADTLLLRPLPFRQPERLVFIGPQSVNGSAPQAVRPSELEGIRSNPFVESAFSFSPASTGYARGFENVMQVDVTLGMTEVLGVAPIRGRTFSVDDFVKSPTPSVLISERLWSKQFGSDPEVIGSTVTLSDRVCRVIGILPPRFDFPVGADVWRALPPLPIDMRGLLAIARLKPGIPAGTTLDIGGTSFLTLDMESGLRPPNIRSIPLVVVMAAAVMLLAVAWIHLGMLRATQLAERQRDIAIRLAIGAGRWTLYRQVLVESLLFVGLSATLSYFLLPAVVAEVTRLVSRADTRGLTVAVDYRTILFLAGATFIGMAVTTLAPVRLIARVSLMRALRDSGQASTQLARLWRIWVLTSQVLVVATSVFVSVALVQNVRALSATDFGFNPKGVLAVDHSSLTAPSLGSNDAEMLDRIRQIPGVFAAAGGLRPLSYGGRPETLSAQAISSGESAPNAFVVSTTPRYFSVLQARVIAGRDFQDDDDPRAVVISERLGWSIGKGVDLLKTGVYFAGSPRPSPVIGVVKDVFAGSFTGQLLPNIYVRQQAESTVIRADPRLLDRVAWDVAHVVKAPGVSPDRVRIYRVQDSIDKLLEPEFTRATIVGLQTVAALLLSILAVYVTAASAFRQQLRSAAIRKCLGSSTYRLLAWFSRDLALSALFGTVLGVVFGALVVRFILPPTFTYGVFGVTAGLTTFGIVVGCCVLAALEPSYRIIRTDPSAVLRDS